MIIFSLAQNQDAPWPLYGQNVHYQLVIERLTKLVTIHKVNCNSMLPRVSTIPAHDL